ncbi:MAG: hypothetical protein HRT67_02595 [Flavobacteriaceae bacterium]|nr:hypothetical protein [Flavobacteriaceae bacterium]
MKKFLKKIRQKVLLLMLVLALLIGGNICVNYNHAEDFPATLIDKYQRLEALKDQRKLIITGGSSSSYSINSLQLQETFKLPVVNTALAMSLGSNFHLNLIKDYLKKGDVVLYIPEYEFYYGRNNGDDFLYTTGFYCPKMLKDFSLIQQKEMFRRALKLSFNFYKGRILRGFKSKAKKENGQYSRLAINELGDNMSLLNKTNTLIKPSSKNRYQKLATKEVSQVFIDKLKEFSNLCQLKGVTFLIAFPPLEESQFSNHFSKDIDVINKKYEFPFIGHPKDDVYEIDLFYDTSYHLIGKGRTLRTNKLIERIQNEGVF